MVVGLDYGNNAQTDKDYFIYSYDDVNKRLSLQHGSASIPVVTEFNAFGDKVTVTDGNKQSTSYHYDAKGQLTEVDGPEQSQSLYTYNKNGLLVGSFEAQGLTIHYYYDGQGRTLSKIIDPEGLAISSHYRYDAIGRKLSVTEAGLQSDFSYDAQGNLIKLCLDPQGLNLCTEFSYNFAGLLSRQIQHNPQGLPKITAYSWDNLGRCIKTCQDPDGLDISKYYSFDSHGNLIAERDAKGQKIRYLYDEYHRLSFNIDAKGFVTSHSYNRSSEEIMTIRYAKAVAIDRDYDEASLVAALQADENADQGQFFEYDQLGNLVFSYDSLGYANQYYYDANNNLLVKTAYCRSYSLSALKNGSRPWPRESDEAIARKSYFAYDGLNRLVFQLEPNGVLSGKSYNRAGLLSEEIRYSQPFAINEGSSAFTLANICAKLKLNPEKDQATRYYYDKAQRLIYKQSPCKTLVHYSYNAMGKIIEQKTYALAQPDLSALKSSEQDRTLHFIYDACGREIYQIGANGEMLALSYDALSNVLSETRYANLKDFSFNSSKNRADLVKDSADQTIAYRYDALQRLLQKTDALEQSTLYSYDANSNLETKTEANAATWDYVYDENNRLIASISPPTACSFYEEGLLKTQERRIKTVQEYDNFGNVIALIKDADGLAQSSYYRYDFKNQKIETIYPNKAINQIGGQTTINPQREEISLNLSESQIYNAYSQVIASKDCAGNWQHFAYDLNARLVYSVDAFGQVTGYSYDSLSNVSTKTIYATPLPEGLADYNQDSIAQVLQTDAADRHEYYRYDAENRLILTQKDEVLSYNPQTLSYARLRPSTALSYSAFSEIIASSTRINENDFAVNYTYYNLSGLKSAQIDALGYLTCYEYDAFGNLSGERQYAEPASFYDEEDYKEPATNEKDRIFSFNYDALGRLKSKTQKQVRYQALTGYCANYNNVTADLSSFYAYDAMGNLVMTTDPLGSSAYRYYNQSGQLILEEINALGAVRKKTYDLSGNMQAAINEKGAITTYAYDKENRLLNVHSDNSETHYKYNERGDLIQEVNGLGSANSFYYDTAGSMIKRSDAGIERSYTYDEAKRKTSEKDSLGNVQTWRFDAHGRLLEHRGLNGEISTFRYNYNGLLLSEQSNLGKNISHHYYSDGQLQQYVDESRLEVVNFSYDAQGNVSSKASSRAQGWIVENDAYEYDALGRLVKASYFI